MANSPLEDKKHIVKLAHLYFQEQQWDRALNEYRKILALDPEDMNTHSTLGDIYTRKDIPQAAYEAYNRAVTGFIANKHVDKAITVYRKIIRLNGSKMMEETRVKMAFAVQYVKLDDLLKLEQFEEAVEMLGKILKAKADDAIAKAKLNELEEKLLQVPPSVLHFQTFGDLFLKHNILDKAQVMFKKIPGVNTKDKAVRANMAQMFVKKGSDSEAKKEYLSLAEEALAENNIEAAKQYAQKALELKSVEATYVMGMICFKQRKWEEAKTELEKLLRIKVNHLGAIVNLGRVMDALGQPDKAKEFFHKALMIDKENVLAQEAWADFCMKRQDKETAIPNLTVLLDKAIQEKQTTRAIKFARMLTMLDAELIFPHAKLVQLLQDSGDLKAASDACCGLAYIYEEKHQYQGALEYLQKALELTPENAEEIEKAMLEMQQKLQPPVVVPPVPIEEPVASVPEPPMEEQQVLIEVAEVPVEAAPEPPPIFEEVSIPEDLPTPVSLGSLLEETSFKPVEKTVVYMNPDPLDSYKAELQTAEMCIKQGLLKAAIDIYHQLLDVDPSLEAVRNKLNDVNAIYLKKWMESKVIKAPVQPNPFLITPPSFEKKSNTNR